MSSTAASRTATSRRAFLRTAYYQLADRIAADAGGGFVFRTAAGQFPIGRH
jgi:hypothetical protein